MEVITVRNDVEREEDIEGEVDVKDEAAIGGRIDDMEVGNDVSSSSCSASRLNGQSEHRKKSSLSLSFGPYGWNS